MKKTNNFDVRYLPPQTPIEFKGIVIKDADDFYTILINPNLSYDGQRDAFSHEYAHMELNHFYDDRSIAEKEAEAENRRFEMLSFVNG